MKGTLIKRAVPEDALAAGFFDALIGNQDRHAGQFRFDESSGRLGLLDTDSASRSSGRSAGMHISRSSVGSSDHSSQMTSADS